MPDAAHFAKAIVHWVWHRRKDPEIFVPGSPHGRAIKPSGLPVLAVRVVFSAGGDLRKISLRDGCVQL